MQNRPDRFAARHWQQIPEHGFSPGEALHLIEQQISSDADPARNLGTFSACLMEAEAEELLRQAAGRNLIDQHAYPALEDIHQQVVSLTGQLFNVPQDCRPVGMATIGSSEAVMLGLLAHKFTWRRQRRKASQPAVHPNIVMGGNVHACWQKFALYFDVQSCILPARTDQCVLAAEQVAEAVDENTVAVSCVLGNTYTGQLDEIAAINAILLKIRKEKGWDIPIHVDAAIGGFIAPFAHPELLWDFRLEQVRSINVSNHKFGLVCPGMGTLLFRDRSALPDELIFDVPYLGSALTNYSLNFSRPSSMILLQYYNFLRFGRAGYCRIAQETLAKAQALEAQLLASGRVDIISNAQYLPMVVFRLKHPYAAPALAVELAGQLRARHWIVPTYALPVTEPVQVLRIVVKPNWTSEMIEQIAGQIKEIISAY